MERESRVVDVKQMKIGKQIMLPWSKAFEISVASVKIRFGRSLITMSGIVLAIAFLMSIWTSNSIVSELKLSNDPKVALLLQKKGIEIVGSGADESAAKDRWLVSLSLLVCVVGIVNAMLMSVTERFREIGTMKCLGALDSFILKLFLLESLFLGAIGTVIGVLLGFLLSFITSLLSYKSYVLSNFPAFTILRSMGLAFIIGCVLSVLGALYPAYVAAKMEPVEAMRVEE